MNRKDRKTERREHLHEENKLTGPSVIQKEARTSTCGHTHISINTHHLGRRGSQNTLNISAANTHANHICRSSSDFMQTDR